MSGPQVLYRENTNTITVRGLHDAEVTGALKWVNTGVTVQVTLLDQDGVAVAGQSWPTSLTYVTGSNGKWSAALANALVVRDDQALTARVVVDDGAGVVGVFHLALVVRKRGAE